MQPWRDHHGGSSHGDRPGSPSRGRALRRAAWKFACRRVAFTLRIYQLFLSTFAWGTHQRGSACLLFRTEAPLSRVRRVSHPNRSVASSLLVLSCQLGGVGPGRNERAPPYDTSVFRRKIIRKRPRTSPVLCQNLNFVSGVLPSFSLQFDKISVRFDSFCSRHALRWRIYILVIAYFIFVKCHRNLEYKSYKVSVYF